MTFKEHGIAWFWGALVCALFAGFCVGMAYAIDHPWIFLVLAGIVIPWVVGILLRGDSSCGCDWYY